MTYITDKPRLRSDAPTVVLHWLLAAALFVSLATGLRISADRPDASVTHAIANWLPQGAVGDWHIASATAMVALLAAYLVFLWRAQLGARVALNLKGLAAAEPATRRLAANRLIYWFAYAGLATLVATGALIYLTPGLLPAATLLAIHRLAAWGLLAYVALHVGMQLAIGGPAQLLKILRPRLAYGAAAAAAVGASAVATAVALPAGQAAIPTLVIPRVAALPVIDGAPDDAAWNEAQAVTFHTFGGSGFIDGETPVRVRAVHDGEEVAMLFEWADPTRSQKHLPLVKREQGWQVMESRYAINDENDFYEDKFAVMLSRSAEIGGGATRLGQQPIPERPAAQHGRGLHVAGSGGLVDVWHWKSVRVGPLGQVDDNYFGAAIKAPENPKARYTGGYTQDPKSAGGFEQNWKKIDGSRYVEPKRLPRDLPAMQARLGRATLDPQGHDEGEWWLPLGETVAYDKTRDDLPVGTILPSVLIDRPFEGDRGDVKAVGSWKDGWWRLEVRRKRGTGSEFDLPLASGTYLWVAAFDHTQARHTRHLHPARLELR